MKRIAYVHRGSVLNGHIVIIHQQIGRWCIVQSYDGGLYPKLRNNLFIIGRL